MPIEVRGEVRDEVRGEVRGGERVRGVAPPLSVKPSKGVIIRLHATGCWSELPLEDIRFILGCLKRNSPLLPLFLPFIFVPVFLLRFLQLGVLIAEQLAHLCCYSAIFTHFQSTKHAFY